jgi:Ca-activated chloride channel family protein
MNSKTVRLEARQDCPLVSTETVTKRLIEILVTAPELPRTAARLPLNLALVIDRSGSMADSKLEYVKQAACHVLDCLQERDQVCIFAFDHEVMPVAESSTVSAHQRTELKARINALRVGGNTNLFDGWLYGVNEVATHPMPHGIQRCLLLTDGQANHGETRQEELERHARELRLRGISTSTFGVGSDFNQFLLEGMATHGGGHYYYIEHPTVIPALFQQELGELLAVTARRAALKLTAPSGTSLTLLGDIPHDALGRTVIVPLGDLFTGSQRILCLEALTPTGKSGTMVFTIELTYLGETDEGVTVMTDATFTYASENAAKTAPRDWPLRQRAAELRVATAETRALRMAEEGKYAEASAMLLKVVNHYADRLGPERVTELRALAAKIERSEVSIMESKVLHDIAYKRRYTRQ